MMPAALEGIRVLELSGLYGGYAGKLFADLGAAVTLVEPPEGSPMRAKPPFAGDRPGPDRSIPFAYFAANKGSVVVNLRSAAGLAGFEELAANAHLVLLSDHPDAAAVNLKKLREANPALVCVRITPYGVDGPYAGYVGDDLTLMAMGGLLTMAGFPGEAPVVAYGEQGLLAADQFAAVGALAAVVRAERTGVGELIDVSIQESIVMALENAAQTYQLEGRVRNRSAAPARVGSGIFPCRDGEIYLLAGGVGETAMWGNFSDWLLSEKVAGAEIFGSPEWDDTKPEARTIFERLFLPYAMGKTKEELYAKGKEWRVPVAPMSTPSDLLRNAQLTYRGFFVPLPGEGPTAGVRVPGAPYKFSATPWELKCPAPSFAGSVHGKETAA